MKVELLNYTKDGDKLIAQAAKLCYSKANIEDTLGSMEQEDIDKFIDGLMEIGHESPIEHISFTFGIEGVSRITETQLVRHRLNSYSIQSGRYVDRSNFECVKPKTVQENDTNIDGIFDVKNKWDLIMADIKKLYQDMIEAGVPREDARFILPQGMTTKIIVTMNMRNLLHFLKLRLCERSMWEIREMANLMLIEVKKVYPNLFKNVGPACVKGKCPEGKMSCGKQEKMRAKYKEEL